jgi:hypothetical protein
MEHSLFGRFVWSSLDKVQHTRRWNHSLGSARAAEELRICYVCETHVRHADEIWIPLDGVESASRSFCSERFKLNDICEQVVLVIKRHRLGFAT